MAGDGTGLGEPSWGREAGGPSSVSTVQTQAEALEVLRLPWGPQPTSCPFPSRAASGWLSGGSLGALVGLACEGKGLTLRDALLPPPGVRVEGLGTPGSRVGKG